MRYSRIKPDLKMLAATAPAIVCSLVMSGQQEVYLLAGLEGDDLICYALFTHRRGGPRDVMLEYFYTIPERRDEGCCTALLEECCARFARNRVQNIMIRHLMDPENAMEFHEFIEKRGFIALNLETRVMFYDLDDMLDAGTVQTILKNRSKLPPVVDARGAGEKHINALLARQRETGFSFSREECDERYSRFYISDDRISGALIASLTDNHMLFIPAIYMDETAQKHNMFLELFSECVGTVYQDIRTRNLRIIFSLDNGSIYRGLLSVFNPPDVQLMMLEYMKPIG